MHQLRVFSLAFDPSSDLERVTSQTSIDSGPHIWNQGPFCSQWDESPEKKQHWSFLSQLWAGSMQLNEPLLMQSRPVQAHGMLSLILGGHKPTDGSVHCQELSLMALPIWCLMFSCPVWGIYNPKGRQSMVNATFSCSCQADPCRYENNLSVTEPHGTSQGSKHPCSERLHWLPEITTIRTILKSYKWWFGGRFICW